MQEGDQEARYSILTQCECKVKALESSSESMAYHRTRLSGIASIASSTCPNCNHYDRHKPSEQLHGLLIMPLVQSFHGGNATKDSRLETHRSFEIGDPIGVHIGCNGASRMAPRLDSLHESRIRRPSDPIDNR